MKRAPRRPPKARSPEIEVLFVAGFGPIVRDPVTSGKLYEEALRIPFEPGPGGYRHTERLDGVKHFALWPLEQAAESCFGSLEWPRDLPIPQAWIEFDVVDVEAASERLKERGFRLLVTARKEPWGQTVTRLLGPEGLLVGVTRTPWFRDATAGTR